MNRDSNRTTAPSHQDITQLEQQLDLLRAQQREMYRKLPPAARQKLGFAPDAAPADDLTAPNYVKKLLAHKKNKAQLLRNVRVSVRYKYTWFPVSKVANSSIKHALFSAELPSYQRNMITDNFGVMHNALYGPLLSGFQVPLESELMYRAFYSDDYYRFAFVRHPYSRVLSCYLDRVKRLQSSVSKEIHQMARDNLGINDAPVSFEDFVRVLDTFESVTDMNEHYRPCYNDLFAGDVDLHFVGRFESVNEDFEKVRDHLGLDPEITLGQNHPTPTGAADKLKKFYSPRVKRIVDRLYAVDFEMYGYKRDFDAV